MKFLRLIGAFIPLLIVIALAIWSVLVGNYENLRFFVLVGLFFFLFVWLNRIHQAIKQDHKDRT